MYWRLGPSLCNFRFSKVTAAGLPQDVVLLFQCFILQFHLVHPYLLLVIDHSEVDEFFRGSAALSLVVEDRTRRMGAEVLLGTRRTQRIRSELSQLDYGN